MDNNRTAAIITFLKSAEALKDTLRTAHTLSGRVESTAEHTWRLCLMVLLFSRELPDADLLRMLKLCIVHDLAEAVTGDIPAIDQSGAGKSAEERSAIRQMVNVLPDDLQMEVLELWEEYEAGSTNEAVLVKGFDKLETLLQHNQGANPADFDYAFNLEYGRSRTDQHPVLRALREMMDKETRSNMGS